MPACQTGTDSESQTPAPAPSLTLKTASYEGTGSPQCIKELGFQPVLVIIKGDTSEWTVWRSGSMEGDTTADFASGQPNIKDAITSLDPGAFSLGKDPSVNAKDVTYYYVAFADSPDIKVGSYVGDGVDGRSITGVGFQPALVFVKWDGLRTTVWTSTAQPEGASSFLHGQSDQPNFIRSLLPDGFQVSADPWVNQLETSTEAGAVYHYVAFREAPGHLQIGTYVGDNTRSQAITGIGFQPDYLWIKRNSAESRAVHRPSSLSGDATLRFGDVPNGPGEITALLPDGFQVGPEAAVNFAGDFAGDTYYYVAWKSSGGP